MVPFRAGTSCSNFCLIYPFRTCGGCLNRALQSWTGAAPLAKEPLSSLELLPNSQVSGLDFARLAIDEAAQRHPQATFLWTPDGEIPHDFDVVLSSNCLEHFEEPLAVATDHVRHCRSLYIILVPYKEHPLARATLRSVPRRVLPGQHWWLFETRSGTVPS